MSALSGVVTAVHPHLRFLPTGPGMAGALSARPSFPQMEWQDAEFGVIFHFDISVATKNFHGDNDTRSTFDPKDYNPRHLDTDQWIRAAKDAGAAYAVFTATHFGGFLQWQSDLYPYGLKQAAWKGGRGDIVADFVKSCGKYGIKPGLYLSTHRNAYWQVDAHFVDWGKGRGTAAQQRYNRVCEKMTEELCSRYGRLLQIWYDAGVKTPAEGGPDVLPVFERLQPHGIFYSSSQRSDIRWVGNEKGFAGYPCWATMPGGTISHNSPSWKGILGKGDPDGTYWSPAMVDTPLRGAGGIHSWFWKPGQDKGVYSLDQLLTIHERSVGRNSNMLLGVVVNPEGLVPEGDAARLTELGKTIQRIYGHPAAATRGEGKHLLIRLKKPVSLNRYVLEEDIQFGERVRSYRLKGRSGGGQWSVLDTGSCIGHKRIGRIDPAGKYSEVVLEIAESTDEPRMRRFALY